MGCREGRLSGNAGGGEGRWFDRERDRNGVERTQLVTAGEGKVRVVAFGQQPAGERSVWAPPMLQMSGHRIGYGADDGRYIAW